MTATKEPLSYGNWTQPRSAGLFGMTFATSMTGLGLIIVSFFMLLFLGPIVAVVFTVTWFVCMVPLVIRIDGRTGYELMIVRRRFKAAKKKRETIYHSGPFSQVPGGNYLLPGTLAPSKLYAAQSTGGYQFGLVHIPRTHHFTVVFKCFPQGDEAIEQDTVDSFVWQWGRFLAVLGQSGDIVGATAVIESVPETGKTLANEVALITRKDSHPLAQAIMGESAAMLPQDRVGLHARLAITFKATTAERRKDPSEQANEIGRRLPGLLQGLSDAGVTAKPMSPAEITAFVRRAYDPASLRNLEDGAVEEGGHGVAWEDSGPGAAAEDFRDYRHDGVKSVTWEMSQAPSGAVNERVLRRLLAPTEDVPWKRVAVVYRPHTAAEAVNIVDSDFKDAVAAEQSGRGIASAAASLRVAATSQARKEEARGHGLVRFGLLITASQKDDGDMPRMTSTVEDLATQARLRVRRCHGFQAAAFAAGLGCGVILPEHSTISPMLSS